MLLTAPVVAAAGNPPLALVTAGPLSVAFVDGTAPLTVIVRNDASKPYPLRIRYVGAGAPAGLRNGRASSPAGLILRLRGGGWVAAYRVAVVRLTLRRTGDRPTVNGALLIQAGSAAPLVVPLVETPATGFVQKAATVQATAVLGPVGRVCHWLGFGACADQHFGSPGATVAVHGVRAHTTLVGGPGGDNAVIAVAPTHPAAKSGVTGLARITVTDIPGPGSYSGLIASDANDSTPSTLTITVNAQDALWWPVLVVILGSIVGALLTKFYDRRRSVRLLRASLQDAVTPYISERAKRDRRRPDRDYLDDLLVRKGDGVAPPAEQFPRRVWWQRRNALVQEVPRLYWDTYSSKARQGAEIETRVAAMTARFNRWKTLETAYVALEAAQAKLDSGQLIHQDGESVLDLAQGEPLDDAEAQARAHTMAAFTVIAELYADVAKMFAEAAARKPSTWKTDHASLDPLNIYAAAVPLARRTAEEAAALRLDLLRARRLLADSGSVLKDVAGETVSVNLRRGALALDLSDFAGASPVFALSNSALSALVAPFTAFQPATEIRRSVRGWDWLVFVLLAFVTALAYSLTLYVGKDWGSWTDYLSAFVAGATVPAVVNWALFPSMRATTLPAKA